MLCQILLASNERGQTKMTEKESKIWALTEEEQDIENLDFTTNVYLNKSGNVLYTSIWANDIIISKIKIDEDIKK